MISNILVLIINILWFAYGIERVFKRRHNLSNKEIRFLKLQFFFHQFMSIVFGIYILKNGGDAMGYWAQGGRLDISNSWVSYFRPGTFFIVFITFPFTRYFNMQFFFGGLMFGLIGFLGFAYSYIIVRKFTKRPIVLYSFPIFPYLLFLPNLNFWTSGIGKDSLSFFAIMLFFYCLFNVKEKWFWGLFSLFVIYYIRPHIALFLLVSAFCAIIIDRKIKAGIKIVLIVFMLASTAFLFSKVMVFLRLDEVSADDLEQFSNAKTTYLSKAGSAVNMASYPLPLKVFTILYRPLFIDSPNLLGLITSIENFVLLWLTLLVLFKYKGVKAFLAAPFPIKTMVVFLLISSLAFSYVFSNLGIMQREKTQIIMCLLIFAYWAMSYDIEQKMKQRQLKIKKKELATNQLSKLAVDKVGLKDKYSE